MGIGGSLYKLHCFPGKGKVLCCRRQKLLGWDILVQAKVIKRTGGAREHLPVPFLIQATAATGDNANGRVKLFHGRHELPDDAGILGALAILQTSLPISQYLTLYGMGWPYLARNAPHLLLAGALQYSSQWQAS